MAPRLVAILDCSGHAGPPDAQHDREELLCKGSSPSTRSSASATSARDAARCCCGCWQCRMPATGMYERTAAVRAADRRFGRWPWRQQYAGRPLQPEWVMPRAVLAENDRQARHAFPADDANLDAALACAVGDHRGKPVFREVYVVDPPIAALKLLPNRQVHRFKVGLKQSKIRARKARENTIGCSGP